MNVMKHLALAAAAMTLVLAGCADEKVCTDFCGAGSACVGGTCQAILYCEPACGTGEACQDGTCVATLESACSGGCTADQVCVTSGATAACVSACSAGQQWNAVTQKCDTVVAMNHSVYFAGFSDTALTSGPAVTTECLRCHTADAASMAGSAHFKWLGATPDLVGHEGDTAAVGKKNLINNFCIAVASNETRCTQCHAGYGDAGTKTPGYDLTGLERVDCLICHANLGTGYIKATANWGAADVAVVTGCSPACSATQYCVNEGAGPVCVDKSVKLPKVLKAAAQSVGRPARANCGWCHFSAGGGDNVKMGDLASSLKAPTMQADVHMGSTATGGQGFACVDCHVTVDHRVYGAGVSVAVTEGRTTCSSTACHDAARFDAVGTHTSTHLAKIACQTCHVPAFSRQLPTKTDWNWSTAGYKDRAVVNTTFTSASGVATAMPDYNWQKGDFTWGVDVKPAYRWYGGKGSHMTVSDAFTAAGTEVDPIVLAAPVGARDTGGKIAPFKEMKGTQAAMASKAFIIVPHLFGTDGFWDAAKIPATGMTPTTLQAIWNDVLADGAYKAGQPTGLAAEVDFADADWFWAKTRMYMNINHEVAPKATAIGAGGCADCHGAAPKIPICKIYEGTNYLPHGVTCP